MGRTILAAESLESASLTRGGKVTSSSQTIAGNKTFSGTLNLSALTASELLALDSSKNIQSLDTATYPSLTELSYAKGVTSAIQTQLNNKQGALLRLTAGNWNCGVHISGSLSSAAFAKDIIKFYKIYVGDPGTITRLACQVQGAGTAGSKGRMGVYSDVNGFPSTLLLDSGEFTCDSNAVKSMTGLSLAVTQNTYWLAIVHNSTANVTFTTHTTSNLWNLAMIAPGGGASAYVHYSGSFTYAALPANTGGLSLSMLSTVVPTIYFYV